MEYFPSHLPLLLPGTSHPLRDISDMLMTGASEGSTQTVMVCSFWVQSAGVELSSYLADSRSESSRREGRTSDGQESVTEDERPAPSP